MSQHSIDMQGDKCSNSLNQIHVQSQSQSESNSQSQSESHNFEVQSQNSVSSYKIQSDSTECSKLIMNDEPQNFRNDYSCKNDSMEDVTDFKIYCREYKAI